MAEPSAIRLAGEGCRLVLADIDRKASDTVADALGDQHMAATLDMACAAAVDTLAHDVCDRFGSLDVRVNNAGLLPHGLLMEQDPGNAGGDPASQHDRRPLGYTPSRLAPGGHPRSQLLEKPRQFVRRAVFSHGRDAGNAMHRSARMGAGTAAVGLADCTSESPVTGLGPIAPCQDRRAHHDPGQRPSTGSAGAPRPRR
ncbi:SDR family oxidoreductase [Streptomyces violascens]|uniref:SDR family oxidoreductase n=1 Tax=Streptomyces violascens TaxID=67381 RepID=UPI00367F4A62